MDESGEFDIENPVHKFCVSWFTLRVTQTGTKLTVQSWNNHRIPGIDMCHELIQSNTVLVLLLILGARRGVPDNLMQTSNCIAKVDPSIVPSPDEAVRQFTLDGSDLTLWSPFGLDPLANFPNLSYQREEFFSRHYPDIDIAFHNLVNGNTTIFQCALKFFINLTETLAHNI